MFLYLDTRDNTYVYSQHRSRVSCYKLLEYISYTPGPAIEEFKEKLKQYLEKYEK